MGVKDCGGEAGGRSRSKLNFLGGDLLFFGVVLFVLFAEPAHSGMLVGMCRVVVRVRAFHFDGFL